MIRVALEKEGIFISFDGEYVISLDIYDGLYDFNSIEQLTERSYMLNINPDPNESRVLGKLRSYIRDNKLPKDRFIILMKELNRRSPAYQDIFPIFENCFYSKKWISIKMFRIFVFSLIQAKMVLKKRKMSNLLLKRKTNDNKQEDILYLSSIFKCISPIFIGPNKCLLRAITLKIFLNKFGIDCETVFGLRTRPFTAHCWSVSGNILLLDRAGFEDSFSIVGVL